MKKEDENLADNKRKERKISKEKCKIKTLALKRQGKITIIKMLKVTKKETDVGVCVNTRVCPWTSEHSESIQNMADERVVSAREVRTVDEGGWMLSACARLSFPVLFLG